MKALLGTLALVTLVLGSMWSCGQVAGEGNSGGSAGRYAAGASGRGEQRGGAASDANGDAGTGETGGAGAAGTGAAMLGGGGRGDEAAGGINGLGGVGASGAGDAGEGGMGGQGASKAEGGFGGEAAEPCHSRMGPKMVRMPEGYCIDTTEVTRSQYEEWLATRPAVDDFSNAHCEWNRDFVPAAECVVSNWVCAGADCGEHPQVCVDWCHAWAYCQAANKRLCGRIGGGPSDPSSDDDPKVSQWFNACSSHGSLAHPYGNAYDGAACNGKDLAVKTTTPVGSLEGCQSNQLGYGGVFDLSGNIWEWEDSCRFDWQTPYCATRGGAFYMPGGAMSCGYGAYSDPRIHGWGYIGFRCCSD